MAEQVLRVAVLPPAVCDGARGTEAHGIEQTCLYAGWSADWADWRLERESSPNGSNLTKMLTSMLLDVLAQNFRCSGRTGAQKNSQKTAPDVFSQVIFSSMRKYS